MGGFRVDIDDKGAVYDALDQEDARR